MSVVLYVSLCLCVFVCVCSVYVCICGFQKHVYIVYVCCICQHVDVLTHVGVWKPEVLSCCSKVRVFHWLLQLVSTTTIPIHTHSSCWFYRYMSPCLVFYMDAGDHRTHIKELYILSCIPQTQANIFITLLTINLPTNWSSSSLLIALITRNQSFNIWAFRGTFYIQTIIPSN